MEDLLLTVHFPEERPMTDLDHDYEPDYSGRLHQMQTDPPCRVCGGPKGAHPAEED